MSGSNTALKNPPVFTNPETMPDSFIGKDWRTPAKLNALAPYPKPMTKKRISNKKVEGSPLYMRKEAQLPKTMAWTTI